MCHFNVFLLTQLSNLLLTSTGPLSITFTKLPKKNLFRQFYLPIFFFGPSMACLWRWAAAGSRAAGVRGAQPPGHYRRLRGPETHHCNPQVTAAGRGCACVLANYVIDMVLFLFL